LKLGAASSTVTEEMSDVGEFFDEHNDRLRDWKAQLGFYSQRASDFYAEQTAAEVSLRSRRKMTGRFNDHSRRRGLRDQRGKFGRLLSLGYGSHLGIDLLKRIKGLRHRLIQSGLLHAGEELKVLDVDCCDAVAASELQSYFPRGTMRVRGGITYYITKKSTKY